MDPAVVRAEECTLTFHLQDCMDGMADMDPGSVDVVVTSPPYNIGVAYSTYQDRMPRSDYLGWMARWGKAVRRVLSDEGSLFLNVGGKPSDPWVPMDVARAVGESLQLQNILHWVKSIAIDRGQVGKGSDRGRMLWWGTTSRSTPGAT